MVNGERVPGESDKGAEDEAGKEGPPRKGVMLGIAMWAPRALSCREPHKTQLKTLPPKDGRLEHLLIHDTSTDGISQHQADEGAMLGLR